MLKIILLVLVVLIVGFVIVVLTRPDGFTVTRKATIAAPPEVVFAQVNDLHKWDAWSPWAKLDPNMKSTYSGPEAGAGAKQEWVGNNEVGEGNMTIVRSEPAKEIGMRLEFIKPFAGVSETLFTFTPVGSGTEVTWTMSGENKNFFCKAMGLVMNMDKMCGDQFEKGLAQLNAVSQNAAK